MMLDGASPAQMAEAEQKYATIKAFTDRLLTLPPPALSSDLLDAFALGSGPIQEQIAALSVTYQDAVNYSILLSAELLRRSLP